MSLPYTKIEIESIMRIVGQSTPWWNPFGRYETKGYTFEEAHLGHFLDPLTLKSEIVHFATHSLTDDQNPENSRLLLYAQEDPVKESLQIRDIYYLNMDSELMV
ncbi:CHAT domain-containing protein, partial [Arthrospira platensis SPKY1]|nr:CHAT domain-containing protein [Arthrospira platensis SPKY1]